MKSRRLVQCVAVIGSLGLTGVWASGCASNTPAIGAAAEGSIATEQLALVACGSSANEIRGCVNPTGQFRVLQGSDACKSLESSICWNQVGPAGSNALVTTDAAPASVCPNGGVTVSAGVDANNDHVLESAEVGGVAYVCNGAPGKDGTNGTNGTNGATGAQGATGAMGATGAQGANGPTGLVGPTGAIGATGAKGDKGDTSLVKLTPEPAGANCAAGGVRIDTGVDTDRDGVLTASEVSQTAYVCNGATSAAPAEADSGTIAIQDAGCTSETIVVDPAAFPDGTVLNDAYPGVRLAFYTFTPPPFFFDLKSASLAGEGTFFAWDTALDAGSSVGFREGFEVLAYVPAGTRRVDVVAAGIGPDSQFTNFNVDFWRDGVVVETGTDTLAPAPALKTFSYSRPTADFTIVTAHAAGFSHEAKIKELRFERCVP